MLNKLYSKRQISHDLVPTWKLKNVKLTGAESRRSSTEVEGDVGIGRIEERLVKEHKRQLEKSLRTDSPKTLTCQARLCLPVPGVPYTSEHCLTKFSLRLLAYQPVQPLNYSPTITLCPCCQIRETERRGKVASKRVNDCRLTVEKETYTRLL
jgi:hypothetical protein